MLAPPPEGWQITASEGALNRRSFSSAFGQGPSSVSRDERPSNPVDPGWRKKSPKAFPTMMTTSSAEGEALRFSAYQYSPASLVYADDQWADASLADVQRK
eukprot:8674394-Alexandrium_andersonii.AAC.1